MGISLRAQNLPVSSIRKLIPFADKAKAQGAHVYHLNIGQPDVKSPEIMLEPLKDLDMNPVPYAPSLGTKEMRETMANYYHNLGYENVSYESIAIATGASEAIVMTLFSLCDVDDEVMVFEPFYSGYSVLAQMCGVKLVPIETRIENGFHIPQREVIEKAITKKTKAMLFSNPCNPTGAVYKKEAIDMLADIAKKHDIVLISDEVYREYIFVDRPHASLLPYLSSIPKHIVVIDSLSKRYSMCGLRLGSVLTQNKELFQSINKIATGRLSAGIIDQFVGAQAVNVPEQYFKEVQAEYKKRRDVLFEGLKQIDGVEVSQPEGAFYSMVKLPVENAEQFCVWMLEEFRDNNETVMFAPGEGFYATKGKGVDEVRMAYVINCDDLKRSVELLSKALTQYTSG
ncbi:pyridoxal phosphate-dependent aminotransferase [Candidatus Woesebacteria bacterium]|nr:pyridoxal phosphate-dependent aminotransferase [Candidatus Woesebacteria bacterium]